MKKIICFVLTIIFILSVAGCSTPSVDEKSLTVGIKPSEVERKNFDGDFTKIYADFAVESFKNFYDKENNSVICPVSVMLALSMAANGAEGETLEEMKNVLTDGMEIDALNENLYVMSKYLTEGDNSMDIANSVWIRDEENQIQVKEEFLLICFCIILLEECFVKGICRKRKRGSILRYNPSLNWLPK